MNSFLFYIYNIKHIYIWILLIFTTGGSSFSLLDEGHTVKIKSTGKVTLDTPIWFSAELYPYKKGTYTYEWEDNSFLQKTYTDEKEGPISQWNITYSSDTYEPRTVTVRVKVYQYRIFSTDLFLIAKNETKFELTNNINGKISAVQPNVTSLHDGFISSFNVTNLTAEIYDPNGWIRNHTEKISFYWYITNKGTQNITVLGPCLTPSILLNITTPGDYYIQSNFILDLSDQPVTTTTTTTTSTTTTTTTTTPSPNTTTSVAPPHNKTTTTPSPTPPPNIPVGYKCDGWWNGYESNYYSGDLSLSRSTKKYGFFFKEVLAAEPLHHFNISGQTWVRHGEILTLDVNCNGTGPFFYCINITFGSFNKSDPILCNHSVGTSVCKFAVNHYFQKNGTYTLVLKVYNDVSEIVERRNVVVYNIDRKPQLLQIIIPVGCSLVAIIIVIYGIASYIQNKNRFTVEVADFDFCASEETEYKTFFQQLRESIANSFKANIEPRNRDYKHRKSQTERPLILEDDD